MLRKVNPILKVLLVVLVLMLILVWVLPVIAGEGEKVAESTEVLNSQIIPFQGQSENWQYTSTLENSQAIPFLTPVGGAPLFITPSSRRTRPGRHWNVWDLAGFYTGLWASFAIHEFCGHEEVANHHGGVRWLGNFFNPQKYFWNLSWDRVKRYPRTMQLIAFSGFTAQDEWCRMLIGDKYLREMSGFSIGVLAWYVGNSFAYVKETRGAKPDSGPDLTFFKKDRKEDRWAATVVTVGWVTKIIAPFTSRRSIIRDIVIKVSSRGTPMIGIERSF